jgi:hypothetical protein
MRSHDRKLRVASILLAACLPGAGWAQGMPDFKDFSMTLGVKVWQTDWSTWFFQDISDATFRTQSSVYNRNAELKQTVLPSVTVRYKNFFISGSQLIKKSFTFPGCCGFDRKENDINIGYSILPGLAVSFGWKQLHYEGGGYWYDAKGNTVGLSASAPIAPVVSIYGNLGYGRPAVNDSAGAFNGVRGKYLLTEGGLAFPLAEMSPALKGVVATAGYRYQRLISKRFNVNTYRISTNALVATETVDLTDITEGPVFGLSMTF